MVTKIAFNKARSWQQSLFQPAHASSLGLFRILFGLILIWKIFYGFNRAFIEEILLKAHYHFPFSLFEALHLKYLPPLGLEALLILLGIAALLIFAGIFLR